MQEVFLPLFRHLNLGRSRENLRGWLFRVANNLALKRRQASKRALDRNLQLEMDVTLKIDSEPSPEQQILFEQRQAQLLAAFQCLSEQDRCCLRLGAEGIAVSRNRASIGYFPRFGVGILGTICYASGAR